VIAFLFPLKTTLKSSRLSLGVKVLLGLCCRLGGREICCQGSGLLQREEGRKKRKAGWEACCSIQI
jgi:hypothetical protein